MLDTLQKMSGTTHKSFTDSKTITRDTEAVFQNLSANEGKVSYTMTTREVPVISYNDMAFISERNSIIFRAGDSPVWNRNETILPMSWRLFQNTITQPGKEYTLQTIPTLSSAVDFDVRKNQPDFNKMLDKRMNQAFIADMAKDAYQSAYNYTDYDIEQLDPDNYSDEVMDIINRYIREQNEPEDEDEFDFLFDEEESWASHAEENVEQFAATAEAQQTYNEKNNKIYAGGLVSKSDLVSMSGGSVNRSLEKDILKVYLEIKGDMWQDSGYFRPDGNGGLLSSTGIVYIQRKSESADLQSINASAKEENSRTFSEVDVNPEDLHDFGTYEVTDAFYRFLASQDAWRFADGKFDAAMKRQLMQ